MSRGLGDVYKRQMMKHLIYGIRKSVLHLKEYSDLVRRITSGSMAKALAALAARFILTAARNTAAAALIAAPAVSATDMLNFGIMFSVNLKMTATVTTQSLSKRI